MLYAKVVFNISVSEPFDYIVPASLENIVKPGCRLLVPFRAKKMSGYCVGLARKSNIKHLKAVLKCIDETPVLSKEMMLLTKELSDYYCCSWGSAIDTALPESIRKGKAIDIRKADFPVLTAEKPVLPVLIQELDIHKRWEKYLEEIKNALVNKKSSIVLFSDIYSVKKARELIRSMLGRDVSVMYRKQPEEISEWAKIKNEPFSIVLGTRSAVFAPVNNLGLIIIDSEDDAVYKQDQVPHYHARDIAALRSKIEGARFIIGTASPSLEAYYSGKKAGFELTFSSCNKAREIKIIDTKGMSYYAREKGLAGLKYLTDLIFSNLSGGGKSLLFINRRGFACVASCFKCGTVLKCPRCNLNLIFHAKSNILDCRYCNYRIPAPKICPNCNSGYIKFSGAGTEKIENDLHRIFPQAKIAILESLKKDIILDADIYIATKPVVKVPDLKFQLTAVLSIDNTLNRSDFRSSEKANNLLFNILGMTEKRMVIETSLPNSHVFKAVKECDPRVFINAELKQRKPLKFPPFSHFCAIKLRGHSEEKVKKSAYELYDFLREKNKSKSIELISVSQPNFAQLRGNFYWTILARTSKPRILSGFLKINLKNFLHSGIIITVDMDPL